MSRILMVASEATPFAKTGGLADVLGALPKALAARGDRVAVIMPLYSQAGHYPEHLGYAYQDLRVWLGWRSLLVNIRNTKHQGVDFYFVESPELYGREALYSVGNHDYPDNLERFAVLSHAALAAIRHLFRPEIVHCHDWQAGLLPPLMRHQYRFDPTFYGMKILFTIHNIGYQGQFDRQQLLNIGLDPALYRPDLLEFYGHGNLLKGGLVFADWITTVSRAYAREIQTPDNSFGLDGLLRARASVLSGIVNGVDYTEWSPETDKYIAAHYSAADLTGKRACKADLLREFGLPADNLDRPLIGVVSRFAWQKGFDLLCDTVEDLAREDLQFVALGSGDPGYEHTLTSLAQRHPGKIAVRIGYDNPLAHKIEAGADMFVMPSRYEPSGLNQMYSLHYGTVPVVRATGGLDDTVDEAVGFKFHDYTREALIGTIRAALAVYADKPEWLKMMRAGMARDHSWEHAAAEYGELYNQLLGVPQRVAATAVRA
jgi:starch synthase